MRNMMLLIIAVLVLIALSTISYAAATSETGDTRAKPVVICGTTSGGDLKPILTDADGIVQTA